MASAPWSTTSPSGLPAPTRRACFPSIPSIVWYTNRHAAHATYTQGGAEPSSAGLCARSSAYAARACRNPTNVSRLGATHSGTNARTANAQNRFRMRDSKSVSSGEVYLYERTCAHRAALARTCGLPGSEAAQHGATVEDIAG